MIQERYVSFEVAKLLKEKGLTFTNVVIYSMYDVDGNIHWGIYDKSWFPRVTNQTAMEWLREKYHIHIIIEPVSGKGYNGIMCDVGDFDDFNYISETDFFLHPEEAVEAALKYVLENLI